MHFTVSRHASSSRTVKFFYVPGAMLGSELCQVLAKPFDGLLF
jgi:hypothetical protein